MLALNSKFSLAMLMTGLIFVSSVIGQQTPSQRYQPVPDGSTHNVPPSVHVPPQQTRKLTPNFRPSTNGARYTFSDSVQQPRPTQQNKQTQSRYSQSTRPGFETKNASMRGTIQQTSYQVDENGEPVIPAILLGNKPAVAPMVEQLPKVDQLPQFKLPTALPQVAPVEDQRRTPADFAASIDQIRSATSPRIAPNEIATQQQSISEQMAELRRLAEEKAKAKAEQAALELAHQEEARRIDLAQKAEAERMEIERLEREKREAMRMEAERIATAQAEAQQQEAARQQAIQIEAEKLANERIAQLEAERKEANRLATERAEALRIESEKVAAERAERQRLADLAEANRMEFEKAEAARLAAVEQAKAAEAARIQAMKQASAAEFISSIGTPQDQQPVPAAKRIASIDQTVGGDTNQVRQVSNVTDAPEATISLAAPALNVETFGPRTVGVNKAATYQVVVKNNSTTLADRILVGINLPQWVDIENVNLTTGGKEITDGQNQARLVWTIDKIPGNASQTITVTAVPRKAEAFDVGVEWTLVPRVGKSSVAVTEPKLEMTISGPQEVLYGETALYHVTCRNPGTGPAESVVVMLPEALGGERATLGDIEAGKEKNFQVELLARTAGDLNLIATAAAEQDLKTSAERALVVRRGNLDVAMKGPGLKYAGSGAQYQITVTNSGDATAQEVVTAVALPPGVKYLSGVDAAKRIEGGLRWSVGNLDPGQTRSFKINCELNTSGDLQLEVGARGKGELAASSACLTTVETVADLVLTVADPKGPLPTGEKVPYTIKVVNRGSKSAKGVNLVMQFSEGIEPLKAVGLEHRIVPGQVLFTPIPQIDPGQEMSFKVSAEALKSGTHIFRAQLTCQDSDAREIAEGTTRFFGEKIVRTGAATKAPETKTESNDFSFQR